jgi:glycosyltransferase involved in cell wall biosynthesis
MNSEKKLPIEVFIFSYNRKDYLGDAIRSVLSQTYQPLRLIVSDNSPAGNETVSDYVKREFPFVELRRRSLSMYDHFNAVLAEMSAPYIMLFHDDDILEPNYVADRISELEATGADAACANGYFLIDGKKTNRLVNPWLKKDLLISNAKDLAINFLDYSRGVNAFPGYVYRRKAIADLKFNFADGGQYSDVPFILRVAQNGKIFWSAKPAMHLRKHVGNFSENISFKAVKRLTRFIVKQGIYSKDAPELKLFRYWSHFFSMRSRRRRGLRPYKAQVLLTFIYFSTHPFSFIRKMKRKFIA